ncbi:hypothetical protein K5Q02_15595 [Pseudomonas sp. MM211]|uniref:hypothetical protein n=1 Tax=Pseudomonas sp. MM211 TaxID=2866808 RepID=UPI001CED4EE4|nr:hypothetical protein [Pseudomonas sp. MM211]UCJ15279.1 hypothetical protein K5Q02_15595 [Pseudomonas sp. MM211]
MPALTETPIVTPLESTVGAEISSIDPRKPRNPRLCDEIPALLNSRHGYFDRVHTQVAG